MVRGMVTVKAIRFVDFARALATVVNSDFA
jgi:hypothetical protein